MSRLNANGSSVTDIVGVMPVKSLDGGNPPVWSFPELGAETFVQGCMVCLSGVVGTRLGITQPGTDASGYGILGFSADAASGQTSSFKGVWIANPTTVFVGNVNHNSTSSTGITAASDLGRLYGLTCLSGRTYVDKSKTNTSTTLVRVIGLYDGDTVGTFQGRVYFQVLDSYCQLMQNSLVTGSSLAV